MCENDYRYGAMRMQAQGTCLCIYINHKISTGSRSDGDVILFTVDVFLFIFCSTVTVNNEFLYSPASLDQYKNGSTSRKCVSVSFSNSYSFQDYEQQDLPNIFIYTQLLK